MRVRRLILCTAVTLIYTCSLVTCQYSTNVFKSNTRKDYYSCVLLTVHVWYGVYISICFGICGMCNIITSIVEKV